MFQLFRAWVLPLCTGLVLIACDRPMAPASTQRPFQCDLGLRVDGWTLEQPPLTPREDDPTGSVYGVFAVTAPRLTEDEVRALSSSIGALVAQRAIAKDEWEAQPAWSSDSQPFAAEDLWAIWSANDARLEVGSTTGSRSSEEQPAVGDEEAFRRFRCVLQQLEGAAVLVPGTISADGARLSRRVSSTWSGGELTESRVETYEFRAHRLLGGVVEPHSQLRVSIGADGTLERISVGLLTVSAEGPPQSEAPLAPGFDVQRTVTAEALRARFLEEAERVRPGVRVLVSSSGLSYARRPETFGEALVPMHDFHFSWEGIPTRGGSLWSYRIDDETAPRWMQFGE